MDFSTAWINGRTLKSILALTKTPHAFARFHSKDRVSVIVPRDARALGINRTHAAPFVIERNLLVTMHDLAAPWDVVGLPNLRFTTKALRSASHAIVYDPDTRGVVALGKSVRGGGSRRALEFSERVCVWGDGERVWANMLRHHGRAKLGSALSQWLDHAAKAATPAEAIAPGVALKGLGTSFASKHLRHLAPRRFGVLDDVIWRGLGYALNPAGYNLFIADLEHLQRERFRDMTIAAIEAGLYGLVRQLVRSRMA